MRRLLPLLLLLASSPTAAQVAPETAITVDPRFRPAPPLPLIQGNGQLLYVEAGPDGEIRRMMVLQRSTVGPNSDRFFGPLPADNRMGSPAHRVGTRLVHADTMDRGGAMRRHLEGLGYKQPMAWKMAQIVRAGDSGLSLVQVNYLEADASGGAEQAIAGTERERLFAALVESVTLSGG